MTIGDFVIYSLYYLPFGVWIVAIILGVIMLRRGGGRAERLWVSGASLLLASSLITRLALQTSLSTESQTVYYAVAITGNLIYLVGIICLVYAFWTKFKVTAHA